MAETIVRYDGETRTTIVVFGDEGSSPLLGAYTLEGLRLAADPVNRRLVRVRGLAMRFEEITPVASSLCPEQPTS